MTMTACLSTTARSMETPDAPPPFVPHALHDAGRCWPETNCYVDLWIELIASLGQPPEAALGFTVGQAFEGDQFTFSKMPPEDLRRLYGLTVHELSMYRTLEDHVASQLACGRIVVMEVDAFWLPDTAATTYRRDHRKTTIAVDTIDRARAQCSYFHNAARGRLDGEDYRGAFRLRPAFRAQPDLLPPYVEIVVCDRESADPGAIRDVAMSLLAGHLRRIPARNPFAAWAAVFDAQVDALIAEPDRFHDHAFHFTRLAGANFELLGSHAAWLAPDALTEVVQACDEIAQTAKRLQFRLARAVARRRHDNCADCLDALAAAHDRAIGGLVRHVS